MLLRRPLGVNQFLLPLYFVISHLCIGTECFPQAIFALATRRKSIQTGIVDLLLAACMSSSSSSEQTMASNSSDQKKRSIRWGIVGLGDVTVKKSGPPFYKCEGSELVAVMRRTPGKAKEFAANIPGGKCVGYDNIDDFLCHSELDAVYVSTRPGTHLEICERVAKAGKACYVEKPVGRCAAETEQIVKLFEDVDLPLYTAYISRAYERTKYVRKLLEEGAIGDELIKVSYKLIGSGGARDMDRELPWRFDTKQSGGGLIMDVGCHVLDRIDYLCGPLVNVKGGAMNKNSANIQVEDFVQLTANIGEGNWTAISHNNGATVECTWDFASDEVPLDELNFFGSKGFIKMSAMSFGPVELYDTHGNLVQKQNFEPPEHTAQNLIQAVTNDLLGTRKEDFLSKGSNAIRASKTLDAVLDSYYGGRELGYWSRTNWPGSPKAM